MQETWVQSLVWEGPTCHETGKLVHHIYWACASEPMLSNKREATTVRSPHTTTSSLPLTKNLRKSPCSNEDPAYPQINKWIKLFLKMLSYKEVAAWESELPTQHCTGREWFRKLPTLKTEVLNKAWGYFWGKSEKGRKKLGSCAPKIQAATDSIGRKKQEPATLRMSSQ